MLFQHVKIDVRILIIGWFFWAGVAIGWTAKTYQSIPVPSTIEDTKEKQHE